jgi:hypothetical protein
VSGMDNRIRPCIRFAALLAAVALPLTACSSGDSQPQGAQSSAAAPSPTAPATDPVIAWADGVCGAAFGVRDNVQAISEDLAFNPMEAATAGDQIRGNLEDRSDAIGLAVEDLGTQIGKVPVDVPEALALATTFETQYAALQLSIDEARSSLDATIASGDVITFGINAAASIGAIRAAAEASGTLASALSDATQGKQDAASEAFAASAVCGALMSGAPRPSSAP